MTKPCRVAKKEPAKPPNMAPMAKAVSLVLVVLMPRERQAISSSRNASQARPDRQPAQPHGHKIGEERQNQDDIVEKDDALDRRVGPSPKVAGEAVLVINEGHAEERWPRNVADAVGAAGEVIPVDQDDTDDFAEGKRHDGEIVAPQAQHRKAKDDAPEAARMPASGRRDAEGPGHDAIAEPSGR